MGDDKGDRPVVLCANQIWPRRVFTDMCAHPIQFLLLSYICKKHKRGHERMGVFVWVFRTKAGETAHYRGKSTGVSRMESSTGPESVAASPPACDTPWVAMAEKAVESVCTSPRVCAATIESRAA